MLDNNIFGFDVPVDDPVAVDVRNRFVDVVEDHQNLVLGELFALFYQFEQVVARAVLHDEVDVVLVVEEAVELDDVGVAEVELDFYLADEGGLQILVFYYLF